MESGINIIKKQIWEIDLDSAQNAFSLQNEWGQFSQTEISPILDQVCNELINEDTIVKIDKIELDLGKVSFTNMEKELPGIVYQAFRESLEHLLADSSQTSDDNVTVVSETHSNLDLIDHFLSTGTLPWWASKLNDINLEATFKKVISAEKPIIRKLLSAGLHLTDFRKRLVNQFSTELLLSLVEILEPVQAKSIQTLFRMLHKEFYDQGRLSARPDIDSFLWFQIFSYIAGNQGKISDEKLAQYVRDAFSEKWPKDLFKSKGEKGVIKSDSTPPLSKFELIKTFLETGILHAGDADSGKTDLDELFKEMSDEQKTTWGSFLRKNIKLEKFRTRLVNHFPPETVLLMAKTIFPGQFSTISETWQEFKTLLKIRSGLINKPGLEAFLSLQILLFIAQAPLRVTKQGLFDYLLKNLNKKWPGIITKRRLALTELKIEELPDSKKLALIIHFMNTGSLPWWASSWKSKDLPGIFMELLKTPSSETKQFLKRGIKYQWFRDRLTVQFSEDTVFSIIKVLEPVHGGSILSIIREIDQVLKAGKRDELSSEFTTSYVQAHFLTWYGGSSVPFDIQTWLPGLVQSLSTELGLTYKRTMEWVLEKTVKAIPKKQKAPYSLYSMLEEILNEISDEEKDIPAESELPQFQDDGITIPEFQKDELTEIPDKKMDIEIDDYFIDNAGLVLLWPYLAKFFEHLELVENNQFIDKNSIYKAAHLLQYLVTGKQEQPEYHFPLNKVLCGLDIEESIPRKLKLKKKESKACEELLSGVVKNWTALKNTSVDGFREAFLKREGKLTRKDNDWVLKIEQKAYDILLEKLPWRISIVKLPWMPGIMYVEWT